MRWAILLVLMVGCASQKAADSLSERAPASTRPTDRSAKVAKAIERGVAYLVASQNADGSWGRGQLTDGYLVLYSIVPGTHDACRVGTTALCVMALREAGETVAHGRGVEYLINHGEARRDDGSLLYNTWAHIYALQALAGEMRASSDPRLKRAAEWHLDRLGRYESYVGGWGYYDFKVGTQHPAGGATSFGTAAALVALWEARQAGLDVPQKMIDRAIRVVERTRLPNGVYSYGADYQYIPRLPANQPRGAVGRTQPCNDALWLWGSKLVGQSQAREGLELFQQEHQYVEMGRKRPFPHESWYQTAPYYYYYDHYYAARMLERLDDVAKDRFAQSLADWIVPLQEADGSWWDFAMWDYHRPYGTAFATMTLLRCL